MPGESAVTSLSQKRAVFPTSREVTLYQMRKIGILFINYSMLCVVCTSIRNGTNFVIFKDLLQKALENLVKFCKSEKF